MSMAFVDGLQCIKWLHKPRSGFMYHRGLKAQGVIKGLKQLGKSYRKHWFGDFDLHCPMLT